jgi:hypothetical protein
LFLLASVVLAACDDSSIRAAPDAGRVDALMMDAQPPPPDDSTPPADVWFDPGDRWLRPPIPDAGADAEYPPYLGNLTVGRTLMLRWLHARLRTMACVDLVYGERGFLNYGTPIDVDKLEEMNLDGPTGRSSVRRREVECDALDLGCSDYLACLRVRSEPSCASPFVWTSLALACASDSEEVFECIQGTSYGLPFDCADLGGECGDDELGRPTCTFGPCERGVPKFCVDETTRIGCGRGGETLLAPCDFTDRCGDDLVPEEFGGCFRSETNRCVELREDGQQWTRCVPAGEACEDTSEVATCLDGDTVGYCDRLFNRYSRLRCSTRWEGSRCESNTGDRHGAACTPTDFWCDQLTEDCDNGTFEVCVAGEAVEIDCRSMGMECSWTSRPTQACFFPHSP